MESNIIIALLIVLLLTFGGGSAAGDFVVPASDSDVTLLARLIEAEARGEPYIGKVAVGAVVVNRVQDPRYPNTVRDVIYQPGQFYTRGIPNHPVPSEESRRAALAALRGEDPTGGALFFYNPETTTARDWWATRPPGRRIGNHVFTH